jgi:hypothetical protein
MKEGTVRQHRLLGIGSALLAVVAAGISLASGQGWDANIPAPHAAGSIAAGSANWFGKMAAGGSNLFADVYDDGTGFAVTRIEQWNAGSTNGAWQDIGDPISSSGTAGAINTMYVNGNYLYVGGVFEGIGSVQAHNIAKYNISTGSWTNMGYTSNFVQAITVDNNQNVYVGFENANQSPPDFPNGCDNALMVQTNGSSSWTPVGGGLLTVDSNNYPAPGTAGVSALGTDGTNIFVAGGFWGAFNTNQWVNSTGVIEWDGTRHIWRSMGGFPYDPQFSARPAAVAVSGTDVFVTGNITHTDSSGHPIPPFGIARFSTGGSAIETDELLTIWSNGKPPSGGTGNGLTVLNGVVYVVGQFDAIGITDTRNPRGYDGLPASNIAQWEFGHWSSLGCQIQGLTYSPSGPNANNPVNVLAVAADANAVFAAPGFDTAGNVPATNQIARWTSPITLGDPVCQGLVSLWRFEGNTLDSIGTNNGILFGVTRWAGGEVGLCLTSVGTSEGFSWCNSNGYPCSISSYTSNYAGMRVPDSPQLNFGSAADFSISAWIKAPELPDPIFPGNPKDQTIPIVMKGSDWKCQGGPTNWSEGYYLYLSSGQLGFQMRDSAGHSLECDDSLGADLRDGGWHHVAVAVQRNNTNGGTLYVDGTADKNFDPTPVSGSLATTNSLLVAVDIGVKDYCPGDRLCGSSWFVPPWGNYEVQIWACFDEVSLYDRALTPCDVWAIQSTGGAGLSCLSTPPRPTQPPVITFVLPDSTAPGSNITIGGWNFSTIPASNTVYFGAVKATNIAVIMSDPSGIDPFSPEFLNTTVPVGATYAPITATVGGLTAYSSTPFMPTFPGSGVLNSSALANPVGLTAGGGPFQSAIGDLDGDGKPDLVLADAADGTLYVYRNVSANGTLTGSSFASPVVLHVGNSNWNGLFGLALGDLDGDGRLDVVVSNWKDNSVSVLQNSSSIGNLSFGSQIDLPVGAQPEGIAVADLDGDGRPDIIVANEGSGTVSILHNLSVPGQLTANSFATAFQLSAGSGTSAVTVGDLDGDGRPEIVAVNDSRVQDTLVIFKNVGTNGVLTTSSFASGVVLSGGGNSVAIGDLDGDGLPDLAVGSYGHGTVSVLRNTGTPGVISTSTFATPVNFATGGSVHQVAIADLDGDGLPDLAAVTEMPDQLLLFKNTSSPGTISTSSFASPVIFNGGYNEATVAIGDLNGDGQPDIIVGNCYSGTISVYQNTVAPHQ